MRIHHTAALRRHGRGFTLIELMIVVVIVAILATVAMPAFMEQIRKSRRADAITSLNKIAQAQERWRANNATYGSSLASTGLNVANPSSGYYTLSVSGASPTGYTASASAAGSQSNDAKCTSFTLTMASGESTYTATGSATAATCWSR